MEKITDEELISIYQKFDLLKSQFKKDKQFGFDLMPPQFFLRCRHLPTQIWGTRIQAYFCYHFDFDITPSSWDCGDFKTHLGKDIEFKCSMVDEEITTINCKQIRLWQDLDYYLIMEIDFTDYQNIKYNLYELTKEQMIEECKILNALPVANIKEHATEKSSLGFSVKRGTEHYNRWQEKYLNKKINIDYIVKRNIDRKNDFEMIKRQNKILESIDKT